MSQLKTLHYGNILNFWIDKLGISKAELARRTDRKPQYISTLTKTEHWNTDTLERIAFSLNLSISEFISAEDRPDSEVETQIKVTKGGIPIYDIEVYGGDVASWDDVTSTTPVTMYYIPKYVGCIGVRYSGKSMLGLYTPGETLFLKPILDRDLIEFGEVHAVDVSDGRRLVKYLRRDKVHPQSFILRSHNRNYDDMVVPVSKIVRIYQVMGSIEDSAMYHARQDFIASFE